MMRRAAVALGVVLAVLLTGCTDASEAETATPTPTVSPTPTPSESPDESGAPVSVFGITCADIGPALSELAGTPVELVQETLGMASSPNWYPGPAQYMTQRAGGVACSYDAEENPDGSMHGWRVMVVPGAQAIVDVLVGRGYEEHPSVCHDGSCALMAREGDALLVGEITLPGITPDDTSEVRRLVQGWVDRAAATQREDFTVAASAIAGVECEQLLPPEQLGALWDVPAEVADEFGGWGVPAEVYHVIDGAIHCEYGDQPGGYEGEGYVAITTLPAGGWAVEGAEWETPISVPGAEAAYSGTDLTAFGRPFIDLVVAGDWIRITDSSGGAGRDLTPVAVVVAENAAALSR